MKVIQWVAESCDICPDLSLAPARRRAKVFTSLLDAVAAMKALDSAGGGALPVRLCRPCAHEAVEALAQLTYDGLVHDIKDKRHAH